MNKQTITLAVAGAIIGAVVVGSGGTDPTGRDMDIRSRDTDTLSRATTATPIRIAAAITIHTEGTALASVRARRWFWT